LKVIKGSVNDIGSINEGIKEEFEVEKFKNNKLLGDLKTLAKMQDIYSELEHYRYTDTHLKLVLTKVLMDHYGNNTDDIKVFLSDYDSILLELSEEIN